MSVRDKIIIAVVGVVLLTLFLDRVFPSHTTPTKIITTPTASTTPQELYDEVESDLMDQVAATSTVVHTDCAALGKLIHVQNNTVHCEYRWWDGLFLVLSRLKGKAPDEFSYQVTLYDSKNGVQPTKVLYQKMLPLEEYTTEGEAQSSTDTFFMLPDEYASIIQRSASELIHYKLNIAADSEDDPPVYAIVGIENLENSYK